MDYTTYTREDLIERINHLENLIEKAAKYVEHIENENVKLKKEKAEIRKDLDDVYDNLYRTAKEAKYFKKKYNETKLKIKSIIRENKTLNLLLSDLATTSSKIVDNVINTNKNITSAYNTIIDIDADKIITDYEKTAEKVNSLRDNIIEDEIDDETKEFRKSFRNRLKEILKISGNNLDKKA